MANSNEKPMREETKGRQTFGNNLFLKLHCKQVASKTIKHAKKIVTLQILH